jgi:Gas vesicle synthesis protein GvpO
VADDEQEQQEQPDGAPDGARDEEADPGTRAGPARVAARRAARHVVDFTGRPAEGVVSIDRADGGFQVGVEVVETRRIPDTQDVLAIYEVRVDGDGDLLSYRRTRRYLRGQFDGRCR